MRSVFLCFICVISFAIPSYGQILPPPAALGPIPSCADDYLYSIGELHYYRTIDCADPLNTGFGTKGGDIIQIFGCADGSCVDGATVDPLRLPSSAKQVLSLGCKCSQVNRFTVRTGKPGQARLVEARLKAIGAGDPRKTLADELLVKVGGKSLVKRAADQLASASSTDLEKFQAKVLLGRIAKNMNTARVRTQQAVGGGVFLAMSDQDFGIGILANEDSMGSELTFGDIFTTEAGSTWSGADAACFEFMDPAPKHYVELKVPAMGIEAYFRLQRVVSGNVVHFIGQQVFEDELPTPATSVVSGNQNVELVQTQDHVHILRIRTDSNGPMLNETNSRQFLLYSGEKLGTRK